MSKRILVADDSDTVRRVICTCLKERNFQVCGDAVDGEDVIEKARMLKPDWFSWIWRCRGPTASWWHPC